MRPRAPAAFRKKRTPRRARRPARRANRVAAKVVREQGPLLGDAVDMGRLVDARPVGTYGLLGMVIGKDKQNVGLGRVCGRCKVRVRRI